MLLKKKKVNQKEFGTSFDRLLNYNITEDLDIDDQMLELADSLLTNCPILVNFQSVKDVDKCNHVLSFLSGVIYAVGGESYQIGNESYLIATDKAFEDGSLKRWVGEFSIKD